MTEDEKREVRRAKLKKAAQLRAELAFKHAQERIDMRLDVQEPALAEIEERALAGEIPVTKELNA